MKKPVLTVQMVQQKDEDVKFKVLFADLHPALLIAGAAAVVGIICEHLECEPQAVLDSLRNSSMKKLGRCPAPFVVIGGSDG